MLETCGRFLFKSPETSTRMSNMASSFFEYALMHIVDALLLIFFFLIYTLVGNNDEKEKRPTS